MKKKLMALGLSAILAATCASLVACNPDSSKPQEAVSYVSMDINPSVELTLDKNNKVVSVYGANEDGQVLLYGEASLVGMDVEAAVDKITALAIDLGYIDENNKVIQTSVSGSASSGDILNKINAQITASASGLNMSVNVSGADAYSLMRKLAQVKEQYPDNEAVQALTPEQFKLVISASEAGGISIEAAVNLDTDKLIKMVSDAHKSAKEYATQAYNKATVLANDAYDAAVGAVTDGIYTTYYMAHHPLKAYYGFAYQGYKTSARGLNKIADALDFVEEMSDYPLDEAQVARIAEILGVEADALKNANGEITVRSIEAYADKVFKNSEASEELENIKTELTVVLASVESAISAKIDELSQEYAPQIEVIEASVNTIIDGIKGLETLIPPTVMTQLTAIKNDLTELVNAMSEIVSDGKISSTEIRALAKTMATKSEGALEEINNDLSDDELKEIAELQQSAIDSIASAKAQLESAIADAEQSAKEYLEQLKNNRKNN